jgi:hypothetical protein
MIGNVAEAIRMIEGASPWMRIAYLRDQERAAYHAVRGWIELAQQARLPPAVDGELLEQRVAAEERHAALSKALAACYDPADTEFFSPGHFEDFGLVRRAGYRAADGTWRERFIRTPDIDDPIAAIDHQMRRLHALREELLRERLTRTEPAGSA